MCPSITGSKKGRVLSRGRSELAVNRLLLSQCKISFLRSLECRNLVSTFLAYFGPHPPVLWGYSWLCTEVLGRPSGAPGIEPGSVLSLQPLSPHILHEEREDQKTCQETHGVSRKGLLDLLNPASIVLCLT